LAINVVIVCIAVVHQSDFSKINTELWKSATLQDIALKDSSSPLRKAKNLAFNAEWYLKTHLWLFNIAGN